MYRWWCEGGGDRTWWFIESVFLRSPDKEFWACLGDLPPDMPRRPETWVLLCNLMLNFCGISRSFANPGLDSLQSNNRKGNSIHSPWETLCQTPYCRLFKATAAYTSTCTDVSCIGTAVERRDQCIPLAICHEDYSQIRGGCSSLDDCCRLVLPYHPVYHATDGTDPWWPSLNGGDK